MRIKRKDPTIDQAKRAGHMESEAKKKLLLKEPWRLDFHTETTFPGTEDLPLRLRKGCQGFWLRGSDIGSRDKAIEFPLSQN